MKTTRVVAAAVMLVMGLAASGCRDVSTPEGVLAASWNSLQAEKVKAFQRTIRGEARERYGNLIGMAGLLEEIRDLELAAGGSALVRTELNLRGRDRLRVYEVEILARPRAGNGTTLPEVGTGTFMPFKTASVECDIDYAVVGGDLWMRECLQGYNPRACEHIPVPGTYPPAERETSRCWVTSLRPATY